MTNTRTITTSVFVNDGDVLVLGGLMDDQMRQGEQRVPGLGRIPGLGWLFRARKTEHNKTNLMVFIRPTILRNAEDARFQTGQKYHYVQELQRQMAERPRPADAQRAAADAAAAAARPRGDARRRRPRPRKDSPMAASLGSDADAPLAAVAIEPGDPQPAVRVRETQRRAVPRPQGRRAARDLPHGHRRR